MSGEQNPRPCREINQGTLSAAAAEGDIEAAVFSGDVGKMEQLAQKARDECNLSNAEHQDIEAYERIGQFISLMKSKARRSLRGQRREIMNRRLSNLVFKRAKGRCEYWRIPQTYDELPFQIDHIIAKQHQGMTTMDNLALCCFLDNHYKRPNIAGYDETKARVVRLYVPRRDQWSRNFSWNRPVIEGKTPIGRATVKVLKMNLDSRVALRQSLIDEGVFP